MLIEIIPSVAAALCLAASPNALVEAPRPNMVLIFMDDMGYGDLSCYGSERNHTPRIDQLAAEGIRFTDFYVAQAVCAPSRGALVTGCFQPRNGVLTNGYSMRPDKYTSAELMRDAGYATAMVGKWHIGRGETGPLAQGFGSYYGLLPSNDYGAKRLDTAGMDEAWRNPHEFATRWNLPLYRNEDVVEQPVNQVTLTDRYTDEAVRFITENKDQPFFLYLAHAMVHVPLFVADRFHDPDPRKAFAQTMAHIDESVGRILDTLEEQGIDETTLVFLTSDNGPWALYKHHAGSAAPLKGSKFSAHEGGIRVPAIARWPVGIKPGGVCKAVVGTIDVLPTLAELAGRTEPLPHKIDGKSIVPLLKDPSAPSPHEFYFIWKGERLVGVREGQWKLVEGRLYNLADDITESSDVAAQHPTVAQKLQAAMERAEAEMRVDVIAEIGSWEALLKNRRGENKPGQE